MGDLAPAVDLQAAGPGHIPTGLGPPMPKINSNEALGGLAPANTPGVDGCLGSVMKRFYNARLPRFP